jgi:ribosome-associated protein
VGRDTNAEVPDRSIALAPGVWVAPSDLQYSYSRSRGPGGQAVNKVSTAVQLRVPVAAIRGLSAEVANRLRSLAGSRLIRGEELLLRCEEHRSQLRNKKACLANLAELVTEAAQVPRLRKPTRPGRAAVERRLAQKRRRAEKKRRRRDWGTEGQRD